MKSGSDIEERQDQELQASFCFVCFCALFTINIHYNLSISQRKSKFEAEKDQLVEGGPKG